MASPPFSLISRATALPRSTPRAARTTLAPSLANACAAARPIPEFPPVTKATLFANLCTVSPPFSGRKRNLHPESHQATRLAFRRGGGQEAATAEPPFSMALPVWRCPPPIFSVSVHSKEL